ncbi:hypothetical protein GCM10007418_33120 [Halopseudomonas salina]|uniref:Uncharacterized protein n=1 Tax=Halopseudomonas salina TaxID=1323744 RepID=A0ABQ1Q379_9GAMM|nr:hypothetical protein GCM10007418_33120 [Halopseudomonas salina]
MILRNQLFAQRATDQPGTARNEYVHYVDSMPEGKDFPSLSAHQHRKWSDAWQFVCCSNKTIVQPAWTGTIAF